MTGQQSSMDGRRYQRVTAAMNAGIIPSNVAAYLRVVEGSPSANHVRLAMVNTLAFLMTAAPFDREIVDASRVQWVITFTYFYILCLVHRTVYEIVSDGLTGVHHFTAVGPSFWDCLTDPDDPWVANEARKIWLNLVVDTLSRIRDFRVHPQMANPVWWEEISRVHEAMGYALLHSEYGGLSNRLMGITWWHRRFNMGMDQNDLARIGLEYLFSRSLFVRVSSTREVSPPPRVRNRNIEMDIDSYLREVRFTYINRARRILGREMTVEWIVGLRETEDGKEEETENAEEDEEEGTEKKREGKEEGEKKEKERWEEEGEKKEKEEREEAGEEKRDEEEDINLEMDWQEGMGEGWWSNEDGWVPKTD